MTDIKYCLTLAIQYVHISAYSLAQRKARSTEVFIFCLAKTRMAFCPATIEYVKRQPCQVFLEEREISLRNFEGKAKKPWIHQLCAFGTIRNYLKPCKKKKSPPYLLT